MIANNSFSKGENQDVSKLKSPPDNYFSAQNFKLVSGGGSSLYALENTKGQSIAFKLPDVIHAIYKIDPQNPLYVGNVSIQIFSDFGGPHPTISIVNIQNYSSKQLAEELLANTTILAQVNAGHYTIQYNNNYVVLVGLDNPIVPLIAYNFGPGVLCELLVDTINNPQIIGAINIKEKLGVYSTEGTYAPTTPYANHPDNTHTSTGQIWECNYDEDTNTIQGLVNGTLVPSVHLKYHHKMNLTQYKKVSGEGRYEHTDYRCHYITDNFNVGRIFNLASTNSFATPLEAISMKPIHFSSVPVIQQISDGGFIKVGRIQYFYQLQSDVGTETTASNASNLISLSKSSLSSTYQNYQGSTQGQSSGKAITLKIENIDTNYDRIKIGYILWEAEGVAIVRYFFEGSVPPNGEMNITHSGNEPEVSFTLEQYRLLQAQWDVCKGYSQKKNLLLAYNTQNIPFDVDVDCRTYRFNGSGFAHLYDKEDTYGNPKYTIRGTDKKLSTYGGPFGGLSGIETWENIPFEEDLINPYNNEDPTNSFNGGDWFNNSQFIYQSNGFTLGGDGPIISYEFVNSPLYTTDELITTIPANIQFNNPLSGVTSLISGTTYSPGNGITYPLPSGLNCSKNPYVTEMFQGYAKGEVYRFSNVFFNTKYFQSFAKWIGDIKFPLNTDGYYAHDFNSSNVLTKHELGIKFTLNTSQLSQDIKDTISGWSYVRMKRDGQNKTRLGTGILNTVSISGDGNNFVNSGAIASFGDADIIDIDWTNPKYATFECPNFKFDINNNFIGRDHIRYLGFLGCVMNGMWGPAQVVKDSGVTKYYYKFQDSLATDVYEITGMLNVPPSKNRTKVQNTSSFQYPFINMGEEGSNNEFDGWGGYTHLISSYNLPHDIYIPSTGSWTPGYGGIPTIGGTSRGEFYRPYVSYERYLSNQYGIQWESRMGQQYIGTNHFQPWDNTLSGSITCEVFGGDTLSTHFGFMKFDGNTSAAEATSGWTTAGIGDGDGEWQIQFFPCEVDFDLELRQGFHAANKSGAAGEPYHDEYKYNTAYSQQNEALIFLSEPYNFRAIEENPYRTWVSQEKFDGEFPNSWGKWLVNNFIDVEGTFGGINRVILNKDKVFFYQDYAIGLLAIKEQQALTQEGATTLVLGEGTVLQRYDYISKTTGCKHQWGVVNTPKGNYHFDATLKKIFMLEEAGDQFGLTDLKGLNVKFQQLIQYSVKDTDRPLKQLGINAEWNPKFNEVYFTILDGKTVGNLVQVSGQTTVTYNELTQCFDCSTHSFFPTLYHRLGNHLLSIGAKTDDGLYSKTMFEHDTGLYNQYHKSSTSPTDCMFPSSLTFIVNGSNSKENWAPITKRFDLMEFITEVRDSSGLDVPLETIDSIRVYNDYQDTGVVALTPQGSNPGSIKRHLRSWRVNYFRDAVTNLPFLKDKAFFVTITFSNDIINNRRFILHDILTQLTPQSF